MQPPRPTRQTKNTDQASNWERTTYIYLTLSYIPIPNLPRLAQIPLAPQKLPHILPPFQRIDQLPQPRILLQPLPTLLRQILIMADLINHHIRIRDVFTDDVWTLLGEAAGFEVRFERGEVVVASGFLVLGVSFGLVG